MAEGTARDARHLPTRYSTNSDHHADLYGLDTRSYELQRDYSVDAQTDKIFREFARVDPKFEPPPQPKTSDASAERSATPRRSKWPRWGSDGGAQQRNGWFP